MTTKSHLQVIQKKAKKCSKLKVTPKWKSQSHPNFKSQPQSVEEGSLISIKTAIAGRSPLECFELLFNIKRRNQRKI